jgi:hypothetical protein
VQHETRAVPGRRTDNVWALGYGGGLQGLVYAEMSRDGYQNSKTRVRSLVVSQRDGLPGIQPPCPFPLAILPCFSFLGKVCLPSLSRGCLCWRQKIRPAHERKLFGGATSSHPPNTRLMPSLYRFGHLPWTFLGIYLAVPFPFRFRENSRV